MEETRKGIPKSGEREGEVEKTERDVKENDPEGAARESRKRGWSQERRRGWQT